MTLEHTPHDEDFIDPACPRCQRQIAAMWATNPDPLTVVPGISTMPDPAAWADPDDPTGGAAAWILVAFAVVVAAALGYLVGRFTA